MRFRPGRSRAGNPHPGIGTLLEKVGGDLQRDPAGPAKLLGYEHLVVAPGSRAGRRLAGWVNAAHKSSNPAIQRTWKREQMADRVRGFRVRDGRRIASASRNGTSDGR